MDVSLSRAWRVVAATLLVGIGAGLAGMAASIVLHDVEHLAYSYQTGTLLEALGRAPAWTRVVALAIAGVVGGVGWWALHRWGRPIVSIAASVGGKTMPALSTLVHVALQIVIVGLGASIGREVAPRELGALIAGRVSGWAGLSARQRRILVACGAGAGLAAVYHVPLGGAMFAVEILLAEFTAGTIIPALATSGIASLLSSLVIPDRPFYILPPMHDSVSLLVWAVLVGPLLGLGATAFNRLAGRAERRRPRGAWILVSLPVILTLVGVVSLAFPAILGNGRVLAQTAFDARGPLALLAVLVLVKAVVTLATIASGAHGGTLTPSFSIGAAFGAAAGGLWLSWWPGTEVWGFALVAAGAFLAGSMAAPMTALLLALEFTGSGTSVIGPLVLAVAGSMAVRWAFDRRRARRVEAALQAAAAERAARAGRPGASAGAAAAERPGTPVGTAVTDQPGIAGQASGGERPGVAVPAGGGERPGVAVPAGGAERPGTTVPAGGAERQGTTVPAGAGERQGAGSDGERRGADRGEQRQGAEGPALDDPWEDVEGASLLPAATWKASSRNRVSAGARRSSGR